MHLTRPILLVGMFLFISSCSDEEFDPVYRDNMREFVQEISNYSKTGNADFIIIPQNGHDLITAKGEVGNNLYNDYINAIDGAGQEDLFYGYKRDNQATPEDETEYLISFLELLEDNNVEVLVTDYCSSDDKVNHSYSTNAEHNFISFAADQRELNDIPEYPGVYNVHSNDVTSLSDAKNFLYLINPENYSSKQSFLEDLETSNYDILIIDLFFNDEALAASDISGLKLKSNGGKRLVISYMSIGEAEDYRYYWKNEWEDDPPSWLGKENRLWKGNYIVKYWDHEWKDIIFGEENSYLDKIISAGFDGVYLDIIEGFENFE